MELSGDKLIEVQEAFLLNDWDEDGKVSTTELPNVVRTLGQNPSDTELEEMAAEVDPSRSGFFKMDSFLKMMSSRTQPDPTLAELHQAFKIFDRRGDGSVSAKELKQVIVTLGEKLKDEEINQMILEADSDGDGFIKIDEFISMMKS